MIDHWKEFFKREDSDRIIYDAIQHLREKTESLIQWKNVKQKAEKEFETISPDILQQLLQAFSSYIIELPAGHSIGHLSRDLIHLSAILHDPALQRENSIELFIGIIGGIFHDIGNSVINRYHESIRFTGHAEAGAFLFGEVAKPLLPEYTLLLIQFAIASHTNYIQEFSVTKNYITKVRKPYENFPVIDRGRQKTGLWITQATDRLDSLGVPVILRHMLTKASPTKDFSGGAFQEMHENEEMDFLHQFAPIVRTAGYKQHVTNPREKTANILEHLYSFVETAVTQSPYSQYDSTYFIDQLVVPNAFDVTRFILVVLAQTELFTDREKQQVMEKFFTLCGIIEPAKNIQEEIQLLQKKFTLLSENDRNHWIHGFLLLHDQLYYHWYKGTRESIVDIPQFPDRKLQAVIIDLHTRAQKILNFFSLKTKNHRMEKLLDLLISS